MVDAGAARPQFQPGVNREQGLGIKSAAKDKPFILTEDPAQRDQFIVHANGEQVEFSSDVNRILIDVLGEMEQRAKESRFDAPDVVVFGSLAYNKALAIEKFRAEHPIELPQKGQPEQAQTPNEYFWTREDMAIAYFAVLAKYRADLAYLAADPNPDKRNLLRKMTDFFSREKHKIFPQANKSGIETDLAIMGRFDSLTLADQEKELKNLNKTLKDMQSAFMSEAGNDDVVLGLDNLTRDALGGRAGRFMMHDYIVDQIVGSKTRLKKGILTRPEYQQTYYQGREWADLSKPEQAKVWSKIDIEKKDEILYEAIERSVGDWAENAGQKILREVRGESLSEDMRQRAKNQLENQKTVDKITANFDKDETARLIAEKEPHIKVLEDKLKDLNDPAKEGSLPKLEIKLTAAKEAKTGNIKNFDSKVKTTRIEYASVQKGLKDKNKELTDKLTALEASRVAAIAGKGIDQREKLNREYTDLESKARNSIKSDLENLQKEVERTRNEWTQAVTARTKLDTDVTLVEAEIKTLKAQEKQINDQLKGKSGGVSGLRTELDELKQKKARHGQEGEHAGEVLTPEGEAIEVALALSEEKNYNSIIQAFFQSQDEALGSLKIDGNTHTSVATEGFRRLLFTTLPGFKYESHKAELYLSDYDIIRNYARAFRINLNIPDVQQDAIAQKIGELNAKLKKWDGKNKIPKGITKNRDELNTLLKPFREKILREIFIRNKFELGNAVRFTIRGMLEKAALGDPFLIVDSYEDQPQVRKAKPGEPSPPPPELYRRLDGDETPIGRKAIVLKDFILSDGNEYFLVIRQDPKDGQVKQELSDDSGRKTEFSAALQEEVYAKLAVNTEKDNIKSGAIPEYSFTDLGPPKKKRKFNIDKASGRMIESEGPESGGFLEDLLKSNGTIQKHFLSRGRNIAQIIEANLMNYIISTQDKIGIIDTRAGFEGPMTWHDEKVPGHAGESLKVVLGNGLLPGSKTKITEVGIHIVPAIPPVSSFKEFDKRFIGDPGPPPILPQLPLDRGKYFYAALFDRLSDRNSLDRRFITDIDHAFNNMPDINTASGTYRVRAENGKFIRTKVADSAGLTIPEVNRQDEELFDGFNKDLESDPNCDNVILNTKMELGRRFMKFLFESYAQPKKPGDVVRSARRGAHRLRRFFA